jgi:hypothetical protein
MVLFSANVKVGPHNLSEPRYRLGDSLMKALSTFVMLVALGVGAAPAQISNPMLSENTTRVSEHVWAIMGFPNIAIVVGKHATLVVDTGLGPKN